MKLPILEHLEELKNKAIGENKKRHNEYKKFREYYEGTYKDGNQLNIIKGIVDTKTTLVLDFDAVSSVVAKNKSFANIDQVKLMSSIADILNDCNSHILKENDIDSIKRSVIQNAIICGLGISETTWKQSDDSELGDVQILSVDPLNYFPDTTAKKVEDCNYIFKKEVVSSITLKKDYPQFIEQIEKAKAADEGEKKEKLPSIGAINTVSTDNNTTQMYADGRSPEKGSVSASRNIVVWNAYLKDDSTFYDSKDTEKQALMLQYPYGRYIRWVEGATDYILEDKPIDLPTGYPFDVIETDSDVKYLIETQNRIDKAYRKIRILIGGYVSFLAHTPDADISDQEIIDQLTIEVDALGQMEVVTNNTLDRLQTMIEYIKVLKEQAYEIARVNPSLISGQKQDGVDSGRMVSMLNESPMTAINEKQKLVKRFIITQGEKNIALIQMYYNVPRILRLAGGNFAILQPQINKVDENGQPMLDENGQPIVEVNPMIQIYQENAQKELEAVQTIYADLSIGEYEVDVIAGTQMPRSRAEKANIYMQLAQMGKIPDTKTGTELLLSALDIPDKTAIMEAIDEQAQEVQNNQPAINIDPETAQKLFKDMPLECQLQYLAQFGFQVPDVAGAVEVEQAQNAKVIDDDTLVNEVINGV
jgi:hypothetical protein